MRRLIRRITWRLWGMTGDFIAAKGRHREHKGATVDWSPAAELAEIDLREPEETEAEAAEREAAEIADYWADLERQFAEDTRASFDEGWAQMDPIYERLTDATRSVVVWSRGLSEAEADEYMARFASGADFRATGEYPIVRELVTS